MDYCKYGINPSAGDNVGSELDLTASYYLTKFASVQASYCHFFAGDYVKNSLAGHGGAIDSFLKDAAIRPIPVQTFPLADGAFEKEKQQAALESAKRFVAVGKEFIDKLNNAHRPVDQKLKKFFSLIDQHVENGSKKDGLDQVILAVDSDWVMKTAADVLGVEIGHSTRIRRGHHLLRRDATSWPDRQI